MRVFDIIFKADHGTTYNSYLIKDKKTVLIDTVKDPFTDEFIAKLKTLTDLKDIDYIITSHAEPDHSGSLLQLLQYTNNATIIGSRAGCHFLKNIISEPFDFMTIEEHPTLNIGSCNLKFFPAPFLHWPDAILTYSEKEKVLFSCDVFSSHYCDERMFDDLIDNFDDSFHYYYDCIIRPFKPYVLKAVDRIKDLRIDIIATGHGPILRKDPQRYIERWHKWSKQGEEKKTNILVLYASIYGNTKKMAESLEKGMSTQNVNVTSFNINNPEIQEIRDAIEKADGLLVGSPTIAGDVPRPVWDVLALIKSVHSKIKLASAFGSFGWSGEATKMIEDRLSGLHIKLHKPPLKKKLVPNNEDLQECFEFGEKFVAALLTHKS